MIDIRAKGQIGEREIADMLNPIVNKVREELSLPALEKPQVQRNQNQSAVGGCDLTGTFCFAIEVKRQEQLSINTWWAQCVKSAGERKEIPVLLFRQNAAPGQRTKWRCITTVELLHTIPYLDAVTARAEIDLADFLRLFEVVARTIFLTDNPEIEGQQCGHQSSCPESIRC
jgi:hypothetical protein